MTEQSHQLPPLCQTTRLWSSAALDGQCGEMELHAMEQHLSACEYCRRPQALSDLPFAIDHIIARQHGGPIN